MIKKKDLQLEDKKVWEEYTKNPSNIYDKDKLNTTGNTRKERFKFDLHGFTLDEANLKVREIILSCIKKNYKEILLITGKGRCNITNEVPLAEFIKHIHPNGKFLRPAFSAFFNSLSQIF